jgi:GH15 family glucan-1,4-alpha-glucosidase
MSIWEVRNNKQNFVYSKVMLWVAFDRGLRLAEKRCLPCPNRATWLAARDGLYEEIMTKGLFEFNPKPRAVTPNLACCRI